MPNLRGLKEGFIKVNIKGVHYDYLQGPQLGKNIFLFPSVVSLSVCIVI